MALYLYQQWAYIWIYARSIKEFPFDGYVCGCGTEVIFHGETLYHYDLDEDLKRSLQSILEECKIQAVYEAASPVIFRKQKNLLPLLPPFVTLMQRQILNSPSAF